MRHYPNGEIIKAAVKEWLKDQPIDLYAAGIHTLVKQRNAAVEKKGDYIEH